MADLLEARELLERMGDRRRRLIICARHETKEDNMGIFSDFFGRGGRVARGQMNKGMDSVEDATFEATVKQTVRDMRAELAKTINASAWR